MSSASCLQLVSSEVRQHLDRPDFSDITFVVESRPILAHRLILSIASDRCLCGCNGHTSTLSIEKIDPHPCLYISVFPTLFRFRAMFSSGFRESSEHEVKIEDCRYEVFKWMVEYIYSGEEPEVLRIGSQTE